MMPLITIQSFGLFYTLRDKRSEKRTATEFGDYDIVELWEDNAI